MDGSAPTDTPAATRAGATVHAEPSTLKDRYRVLAALTKINVDRARW